MTDAQAKALSMSALIMRCERIVHEDVDVNGLVNSGWKITGTTVCRGEMIVTFHRDYDERKEGTGLAVRVKL